MPPFEGIFQNTDAVDTDTPKNDDIDAVFSDKERSFRLYLCRILIALRKDLRNSDDKKYIFDKNEQLELMLKWRDEMSEIKNKEIDAVCATFNVSVGGKVSVNDNLKNKIKKLLIEFPIEEILDAVDISISTY